MTEAPSGKSVFEDAIDTIAPADGTNLGKDDVRWKFSGPWLAGMTEGDFNAWVLKEVRKRKTDFRDFLRTACATETSQSRRRRAVEDGEDVEALQPLNASDITDEQLTEYINTIRRDRTKLHKHIRSFLDLPPSPSFKPTEDSLDYSSPEAMFWVDALGGASQASSDSPYAETGPPKTHPSAGLSYSRTASHTFNHPLYGPQKYPPPVQARVVMPKGARTGAFTPILGVGGFAVSVPAGVDSFKSNPRNDGTDIPGLRQVEPDVVGGSKTWVHAKHARIDPKGRVILNVTRADPEAIAVKEGRVGDIPVEFTRPSPLRPPYSSRTPGSSSYGGGYGLRPQDFAGRSKGKRVEKADLDAIRTLTDFVDGHDKGKSG